MVKPTAALALGLAGTALGAPSAHNNAKRVVNLDQPISKQVETSFNTPVWKYEAPVAGEGTVKRVPPPEILDQLDPDTLGSLRDEVEKAKRQLTNRPPLMPIMPWEEPEILQTTGGDTEQAQDSKRQLPRPPFMAPPPPELSDEQLQNIPEATEEKRTVDDKDVADIIWGNSEKRSMAPHDPEPVEAPSTEEILAAWNGEKKRAFKFSA